MSTTTTPSITPDSIIDAATGFMRAKHLFTGNDIGLFAALASEPLSLEDLAAKLRVPKRTTRIVADALVATGFLTKEKGAYKNGEVAAQFLAGRSPADFRPFLRFWNAISYPTWTKLEASVKSGKSAGAHTFSDEENVIFSEGVQAITSPGARALPQVYDFSKHKRVLDLGGGTGSFLIALLEKNPSLVGCTLMELPDTAKVATQYLATQADGKKVEVLGGNFMRDSIPTGHDAVLVANTVHCLSPENNRTLLKRTCDASPSGARLLLVDFWTNPEHTDPPFAAIMAGEFMLLMDEGDVYSELEVRDWLTETGWRFVERKTLMGPASVIVAEKP